MPHRTEAVPIAELPGVLPQAEIADDVDHAEIATSGLGSLSSLSRDSFAKGALWRDLYALTGTLRTFYDSGSVAAAWTELSRRRKPSNFALVPRSSHVARFGPTTCWIQAAFTFETSGKLPATCSGQIGIIPDGNKKWRIWLIVTVLEEVKGFPNVDIYDKSVADRVKDTAELPSGRNSLMNGALNNGSETSQSYFDCVIVGAGMAGLSVAGRLKALGVSSVTLERNAHVGDNWLLRYKTVRYHTSREYSHLPFHRTFPPTDPYFLGSEEIAAGFQRYVDQFDVNVWVSTNLKSASWNDQDKTWTLAIDREGRREAIRTRHLVLAVGPGGQNPVMPTYASRDQFQGQVIHSKDYITSAPWKGKRGVIIGTANTAHDVAEDMLDAGLSSVTMIQRARTAVIPVSYYRFFADKNYNEANPTEKSDRHQFSFPTAVSRLIGMNGVRMLASKEPERFDALERAGFKVERFGDLQHHLLERLGGHYLDVGASAKVADGLIKMKSDSRPTSYTPTGLVFEDGSTLDADVIVFTTGFEGNLRDEATRLVGPEIGNKLEDFWRVDKEGELLGAWKPIGHPGIWYTGGTIGHARFFSRFLALQIKADVEGRPFERFLDTP